MASENDPKLATLPFDPLTTVMRSPAHARRTIMGVLESYNSPYDALAEAVQNSLDALEDAVVNGLPGPYRLEITIDGLDEDEFATKGLTLEFKNNLEGVIDDINNPNKRKSFHHIDICVCWGQIVPEHRWYALDLITEANLHERQYPGVTHVLRKDGESHVIQVIMLEEIVRRIDAGQMYLPKRTTT